MKCKLDYFLAWHANGVQSLEVEGNTVSDCLGNLSCQLSVLKDLIFDNDGTLSRYTRLVLNGSNDDQDLLDLVVRETDELDIFYRVPS